jgi:hypothetical protein
VKDEERRRVISYSLNTEPIQSTDAKLTEAQAIGRAHRQGQSANVIVVRYIL